MVCTLHYGYRYLQRVGRGPGRVEFILTELASSSEVPDHSITRTIRLEQFDSNKQAISQWRYLRFANAFLAERYYVRFGL